MIVALQLEAWSFAVSLASACAAAWAVLVARAANRTARELAAEGRWWDAWERLRPLGNAVQVAVRTDDKASIRDAAEALAMALPKRLRAIARLARDVAKAAFEDVRGEVTGSFLTPEDPFKLTVRSKFPTAWATLKRAVEAEAQRVGTDR